MSAIIELKYNMVEMITQLKDESSAEDNVLSGAWQ